MDAQGGRAEVSTATRPESKVRLANALRLIRREMRLTLAEVAARTGVAVSTLSKVENGLMSLTYDKLMQLSEGLEVDISVFFSADPVLPQPMPLARGNARRSIARRGEGLLVETPDYDYRYLCADLAHKAMVPILITIRARSVVDGRAFSVHSGEEFIYVLGGSIEVHTEFYAPLTLRRGDGAYIDSTMRHASVSTGAADAVVLNICCSPQAGHFRTLVELAQQNQRREGEG